MSLPPLPILLNRIPNINRSIQQELSLQLLDRRICRFEAIVLYETVAFRGVCGRVAGDFGERGERAKGGECFVEDALVTGGVEVAYEEVGSDVDLLAV